MPPEAEKGSASPAGPKSYRTKLRGPAENVNTGKDLRQRSRVLSGSSKFRRRRRRARAVVAQLLAASEMNWSLPCGKAALEVGLERLAARADVPGAVLRCVASRYFTPRW